jgi:signal peptidase I
MGNFDKKVTTTENSQELEPSFNLEQLSNEDDPSTVSFAKKIGLFIFEIIKVVIISLIIILPIRYYLIQPFYVEGASMEPNFYDKEYLVIDEISYRFNNPQRGEVIILKNPNDRHFYFIKRVIGLPGEKIAVLNGRVFINDKQLEENYIKSFSHDDYGPTTLADDEYFVMGDNRNNSSDSRYFGPLNRQDIIGRVWVRGWPLNRFNTFNPPTYQ